MAQLGFFDADKRLEALSAKGDPLEAIVSYRGELSRRDRGGGLTPDELKKSSAGRKPVDAKLRVTLAVRFGGKLRDAPWLRKVHCTLQTTTAACPNPWRRPELF